ncbi:MAG TPA: methyltransferase domain-containing protein [Dinghuibacter sp.]|uniref:class I SAM-dependent methyltransferase n=1 Tax=Dinghuibacter sp. TaxID=2024697 RepID=UPI002CE47FFC|nr:methyltransferase domain-containing protein [Dinghuibacter sp.]HTJ12218.1 methyltransferase domain-containing protein [Dinghuibacter sp.]
MNKTAIASFSHLLDRITPGDISADPYAAAYLEHLLAHRQYYLRLYADLLKDLRTDGSLIDFGCGNGLLGLFARHCGFEKVALVDVDEHFLAAAGTLADRLGLTVTTCRELPSQGYRYLVGTDVVEHVYDLSALMRGARGLERVTLTTSANPLHWIKARQIKKIQRIDEHVGTPASAANRWVAVRPFYEQRLEIAGGVRELARLTRGLRRDDILAAAARYAATGELPPEPSHPTNTCDPETGSWTERLLYPEEYRQCFAHGGFALKIRYGPYNACEGGAKAAILKAVNAMAHNPWLAAYLILEGRRQK